MASVDVQMQSKNCSRLTCYDHLGYDEKPSHDEELMESILGIDGEENAQGEVGPVAADRQDCGEGTEPIETPSPIR